MHVGDFPTAMSRLTAPFAIALLAFGASAQQPLLQAELQVPLDQVRAALRSESVREALRDPGYRLVR